MIEDHPEDETAGDRRQPGDRLVEFFEQSAAHMEAICADPPPPLTRRVSMEEYLALLDDTNLEHIDGKLLTKAGIELFVGVDEVTARLQRRNRIEGQAGLTSGLHPRHTEAMDSLQDMIAEARKEIRKASGAPLTPEEQEEDQHKAAVTELRGFILRSLDVTALVKMQMHVTWTQKGPAAILKTEDRVFHLRRDRDRKSCVLLLIDGQRETEIARIEAYDQYFGSRVLVAIGDAAQ